MFSESFSTPFALVGVIGTILSALLTYRGRRLATRSSLALIDREMMWQEGENLRATLQAETKRQDARIEALEERRSASEMRINNLEEELLDLRIENAQLREMLRQAGMVVPPRLAVSRRHRPDMQAA